MQLSQMVTVIAK